MVYAIWAGIGTAVMALAGLMLFNEPLHFQKVFATSLIIIGVVMLNIPEHTPAEEQVANIEEAKTIIKEDTSSATTKILPRKSG